MDFNTTGFAARTMTLTESSLNTSIDFGTQTGVLSAKVGGNTTSAVILTPTVSTVDVIGGALTHTVGGTAGSEVATYTFPNGSFSFKIPAFGTMQLTVPSNTFLVTGG